MNFRKIQGGNRKKAIFLQKKNDETGNEGAKTPVRGQDGENGSVCRSCVWPEKTAHFSA